MCIRELRSLFVYQQTCNVICYNVLDSDGSTNTQYQPPTKRKKKPVPARRSNKRKDLEKQWSSTDAVPNIPSFSGYHGTRRGTKLHSSKSSELIDFFQEFIDDDLIDEMKEQTNLYARLRIAKIKKSSATGDLSRQSRLRNWKMVTKNEIRKFLAVIIHMSISERSRIVDHWSRDAVISCAFCPQLLSKNRFLAILANFHVADNRQYIERGKPGHDPLYKARPVIETLRKRFQRAYEVGEAITIDEGMCAFLGRYQYRVYMPDKPNKYGIKLYMLSEARTGYVYNVEVYHGLENTGVAIVKRLMSNLSNKGHTLYTDQFYTSIELAEELEAMKTGLVGTMRKNRKGIPPSVLESRLSEGDQVFRRKNNILVVRWRDKRDVIVLSTRHTSEMKTFTNRRNRTVTKPTAIIDYNKNKSGVDLSDQFISYGVFAHRSVKWWRKLVFHFFLIATVNACIMYNVKKGSRLSVTQFMQKLCHELVEIDEDFVPANSGISRLSGRHFMEKIPCPAGQKKSMKRCVVCSERGKRTTGEPIRKSTSYRCKICLVGLCIVDCFEAYHTKKKYYL